MTQRTFARGTVEYVEAVVLTADDPSAATVQISLTPAGGAHAWLAAGWTGPAEYEASMGAWRRTARTSSPVTLSTANYPASTYAVHAKVALGAEAAIVPAWEMRIT